MSGRREVMHLLNTYTWAGRRGECAVTHNYLRCTEDRSKVTCQECLAAMEADVSRDEQVSP